MSNNYPVFDLSGILCVNQSQKYIYQQAWNDYTRIQLYNSNVSTLHSQGINNVQYYQYISYAEKLSYNQGQLLHTQVYPNSNWNSVQTN
jgi:hypothetical protein